MALNDLYNVIKADRYTADGCEKINKALAKDRVYQNGEISQKTGLMKTPKGWVEPPKGKAPKAKAESKSAAPQKKSQSAKFVKEYLENNFWSQPEDFKNEMNDAGWDVDEMTSEYAVISNESGSQYEVRFNSHGDGRDLTVKTFKALQVDEDDDDDLEDAAPEIRQLTGDTRIRVRKA